MGKIPEELKNFFQGVDWKLDGERIEIHGERVYYMPEGPDMKGIRFLRTGLLLGRTEEKAFRTKPGISHVSEKEGIPLCDRSAGCG
ncbi:MAG: RsmF rRNA methyltransferase first C-terminal domain-containing protein [Lachnoclostridium sp.]